MRLRLSDAIMERGKKLANVYKKGKFDEGDAARLPQAYRKFWHEWMEREPAPVHQIYETAKWKKDPETGVVTPVQNIPIKVLYPPEHNRGLWGGEGVVRGKFKKHEAHPRVPRLWIPSLHRSVIYSEVLDKYMSVVCTQRAIRLIHQHFGLDYYLLKTPACDLKSLLALKLKRKILLALLHKDLYPEDESKREEIYNKYKDFLKDYTEEDLEWYGLSFSEALRKLCNIEDNPPPKTPLKHIYRMQLIEVLKEEALEELQRVEEEKKKSSSWLGKINPFGSSKGESKTSST